MNKTKITETTQQKTSDVLSDIIDNIKVEYITLRELMILMGSQGLLMICVFLTLPFLIPVSIPGVSTVFGAGIILISFAITVGKVPWLPKFIADRKIESKKLIPVLKRGISILRKIDRYLKPRLFLFTSGLMNRFNGLALIFAGILLMMPFGLIPFSNTLPAVAILLLAIGISQRDGVMVALGYLMNLATVVYFSALIYGTYAAGQKVLF